MKTCAGELYEAKKQYLTWEGGEVGDSTQENLSELVQTCLNLPEIVLV